MDPENICFINKPNYYYFYYEGYFSFIKMQRSTLLTFKMQPHQSFQSFTFSILETDPVE